MKFVKANLDLLVTALVVVLAIGAYFFLVDSWKEDLVKQASARQKMDTQVTSLLFDAKKPLVIPGIGPIPGSGLKTLEGKPIDEKTTRVTPMQNVEEARKQAQEAIRRDTEKLIRQASHLNSIRRAEVKPGPNQTHEVTPLLANGTVKAENLLPVVVDGRYAEAFRNQYLKQFDAWQAKLGYAPLLTGSSNPSTMSQVDALRDLAKRKIDEQAAIQAKNSAAERGGVAIPGGGGFQLPQEEKTKITKSVVAARAMGVHIYVDEIALPRREWAKGSTPPSANDVFEGLVDSWLINDAVNAIAEVNKGSSNVGTSPIKRLLEIRVRGGGSLLISGNSSSSGGGFESGGFQNTDHFQGGGGQSSSMGSSGGGVTSPDNVKSMTGHTGDDKYDVMQLSVKIIIDPAYVNRFQEELYKQNNGYTVLLMKITPVDPLDAASNGYLYGNTQCICVEFTLEDLLFRSWLDPIKPGRK